MAFKKDLAQRLFNAYRFGRPSLLDCRISTSAVSVKTRIPPSPEKIAPDPGDDGIFRRFIHRRPMHQPTGISSDLPAFPIGDKLIENLRGMDISRDRIRLDGLIPPPVKSDSAADPAAGSLSLSDVRKLLRLSQLETVKSRLRATKQNQISYPDFFRICAQVCSNNDQTLELAKMLDDSGTVIVLGNVVFLNPNQVVKAIQSLIPAGPATTGQAEDPGMKELEEMEKTKAAIDRKAEALVRRELWGGLGYFVVQTAAFMRLTFWELSWDVMEPICFYVTSVYCMAGYAFFLRTSREPSFEGFFHSRFIAKQKRLMKAQGFDLARYNELKKAYSPPAAENFNSFCS
nr:calcium uniporter protein 2, mitochondrial-like [Ipomoea batatas]